MLKRRTAKEAFEELAEQGFYEEANLDKYEVEKVLRLVLEDYEFGKTLRKITNPNWRVIFNINYDVLRELCSQLMRFKRQKISNHQGLFRSEFGKTLRKITNPNWRVIFNINYDVLRELCSQLMRFKRQKISNHQGLF